MRYINVILSFISGHDICVDGPTSPDLLKVALKEIDMKKCKYSYPPSSNPRINLGILEDSMICAGDLKDGNDTCTVSGTIDATYNNHYNNNNN
jgi:hypothetical protein